MSYRLNPSLHDVAEPPIAEAQGWIRGRVFPPGKPLIDVAQAVPGYPPPAALTDHLARIIGRPEMARQIARLTPPVVIGAPFAVGWA